MMEEVKFLIVFVLGVACGFHLLRALFRWRLGSAAILVDMFLKEIVAAKSREHLSLNEKVDWLIKTQADIALILNSIIRDENRNS